jgi:hypothetical protein
MTLLEGMVGGGGNCASSPGRSSSAMVWMDAARECMTMGDRRRCCCCMIPVIVVSSQQVQRVLVHWSVCVLHVGACDKARVYQCCI